MESSLKTKFDACLELPLAKFIIGLHQKWNAGTPKTSIQGDTVILSPSLYQMVAPRYRLLWIYGTFDLRMFIDWKIVLKANRVSGVVQGFVKEFLVIDQVKYMYGTRTGSGRRYNHSLYRLTQTPPISFIYKSFWSYIEPSSAKITLPRLSPTCLCQVTTMADFDFYLLLIISNAKGLLCSCLKSILFQ